MKKTIIYLPVILISIMIINQGNTQAQSWLLSGNNLAGGEKLGSLNNFPVVFVTNNIERMRIDQTGNVTIGLNAGPNKFLQFGLSSSMKFSQNQYVIHHSNSSEGLYFSNTLHRLEYRDQVAVPNMWIEWLSSGRSYFRGNMGIGTETPEGKLHIFRGSAGTVTANPNAPLVVENSTSNYINLLTPDANERGILFGDNLNAQDGGIIYTGSNQLQIRANGNVNRMIIDPDGNTGINLDPLNTDFGFNDAILQVRNGEDDDDNLRLVASDNLNDWSMYVPDGTTGNLELYKNGSFKGSFNATTGVYTASDKRLKKDIISLPGIMESVMKLQPKKYHYKESKDADKYSYGFIAQDVNEIFPEFVGSYKDRKTGEERLTLNYDNFGVIAIKAIQEQQKQIDEQKKEIEELKQMVQKLSQTGPVSSGTISEATKTNVLLSDSKMEQNKPNPLKNTTSIHYNIPAGTSNAQIIITDNSGKRIKQITLKVGEGVVNIDASALSSGTYNYTLLVDGKLIESKKMVIAH